MIDDFIYLFPFEKIEIGKRILIYGAGDVGFQYAKQIAMTSFAKVVGFIDREKDRTRINNIPIYSIEDIGSLEYDYIVVALKSGTNAKLVKKDLKSQGVSEERLIWIGPRSEPNLIVSDECNEGEDEHACFEDKTCISFAIRCATGIGDLIICKRFIEEICSYSDNIMIDIYAPHNMDIMDAIYSDCKQVAHYISDGGGRYAAKIDKYNLAITCTYLIEIDFVDVEGIEKKSSTVAIMVKKLMENIDSYGLKPYPNVQNKLHYERVRFKGENCISAYNYTGICDINDDHVNIPLKSEYEEKYQSLNLRNYLTIGYGNGMNKGNEKTRMISKQWPIKHFEKLTEYIKKSYPDIEIIQLGTKNTDKIMGADRYFLGESLETVKYILKNSIVHIDIEGGLVHIATQLGTKCIVLFGPTDVHFFGYRQNINIVSSVCNSCSALYTNIYQCAKGLDESECMYSITPELVKKYVDEYMSSIEVQQI